jgi:hypothetical protein
MRRLFYSSLAASMVYGCAVASPPKSVAPAREPTAVRAPFAKTWDAVIDVFADQNIPIATIDRSSGLIATSRLAVPRSGHTWADCGVSSFGDPAGPNAAIYNVLVRGDSIRTTVKVTVSWALEGSPFDCVTKGTWESQTEERVAAKAEGRAIRVK